MDNILEMRGPYPEPTPIDIAKDRILVALFTTFTAPVSEPRERVKRQRSCRTSEGDDACARKKE